MKWIVTFCMFVGWSGCASKGVFVSAGVYTETSMTIGHGMSEREAKRNALAAIPKQFEPSNSQASGQSGCADPHEKPIWDEIRQSYICASGKYFSIVPLAPRDPEDRARLEKARASRLGDEYVGYGMSTKEAILDLKAKLPVGAIFDSYSFGCAKYLPADPKTGRFLCDVSAPGPTHEAKVTIRRSNVDEQFAEILGESTE
ncbi:MAG: hypothetical protein AAB250_00355 [Bdellovibrionota bacterium]